ncbi:MAG: phosphatidylglycerophosphatase A [Planctomycetes bacterium]|nr:phosphatidylglycerophosphatase A [Planctomycetota bacterium]
MLRRCLSTCCYFGDLPLMPGTWGTLPAVLLYILAWNMSCPSLVILPILALSCVVAVSLGSWAEREAGRKDPSWFCLDEFAGYLIAGLFVDLGSPYAAASCIFLAARLFDILKPWPVRKLEKLPGGWGILFDDVLAGIYANVFLQILSRVLA